MAETPDSTEAEETKRQITSFLARAAEALDEVKNVVVRSSQIGKIKIDSTFVRRDRDQLARDLGLRLLELVAQGTLELPEELVPLAAKIREYESELKEQEREIAEVEAESRPGEGESPR